MDQVSLVLDTSGFARSLNRYVTLTGADAGKAAVRASRIYIRHLIAITPPGDGKQAGQRATLTKEDQRRGQAAIRGDLSIIFSPVKLKGKREEQWPDVEGIHRASLGMLRARSRGKVPRKFRGALKVHFVDERKLNALRKKLFARVGMLAAYWLAAAAVIGATGIPAWVRKQGARGSGKATPEGAPKFRFEAAHTGFPTKLLSDMDRRMTRADLYTMKTLENNLRNILARRAAAFNGRRAA